MPRKPRSPRPDFEIPLHLRRVDDLFDTLDPSPLVERALDKRIEDYIVDSVREGPHDGAVRILLQVDDVDFDASIVAKSVENYFLYLESDQTRRIRILLRDGRQALAIGIVFLAACLTLGQLAHSVFPSGVGDLMREGLLIIGWVANWRPVEIFLYDWRPMLRRRRLYRRLAKAAIEIRQFEYRKAQ